MGKDRTPRSLVCFVQALEGLHVLVELRYDTLIRGLLDQVDEHMNLTISDVTVEKMSDGTKQEVLFMHVRDARQLHAREAAQNSRPLLKGDQSQ
ncbi:hypothetical protein WJX77_004190 [Trebouxia sp. C0004]